MNFLLAGGGGKKEGVPGGGQGGRAPARHWLDLPLWFPAGGCVLPRLFFMSYNRFFAPIPLPPFPAGRGETKVIFMQGASPLASPGLNPGGTGFSCGKRVPAELRLLRGGVGVALRCPEGGAGGQSPADLAVSESAGGACLFGRLPALLL